MRYKEHRKIRSQEDLQLIKEQQPTQRMEEVRR